MTNQIEPLLDRDAIDALRTALHRDFSAHAVREVLGLAGEAALSRSDLAGVDRLTRGSSPAETMVRLFLVGAAVSDAAAARALHPLAIDTAVAAGLITRSAGEVRAALDLRPYSEAGGPDWWVISDLGADVRATVLDAEHVLGIGSAAITLAQATIRRPVRTALDLGTGSGVQALHLSRHATSVTATDISVRALRMAATTAALNGLDLDLRRGSFLEPVEDQRFDTIVCNPPFIVGPGLQAGNGGFTYRDSGLAGDEVSRKLVGGLPGLLNPDGTAQLLGNWQISAEQEWQERLTAWVPAGCEAWIWQREVAEPGEYVALWLRDAGLGPNSPRWREQYEHWLDWFAEAGVIAVGMGLINLRRTDSEGARVVCEDVPQAVEQPAGTHIQQWFERAGWLRAQGAEGLLATPLKAAAGLVLDDRSLLGEQGWKVAYSQLRQSSAMRWEIEVDATVAGLVAACNGTLPARTLLDLLAAATELPAELLVGQLLPVIEDLVRRGILLPEPVGR
jgi:methylase of polypeptide subunit release factors